MFMKRQIVTLLLGSFMVAVPAAMAWEKKDKAASESGEITGAPVLWREPGDIASRNLLDGSGGKEHAPSGVMTFVKEDEAGTNPKFVVKDESGVKWKLKLGAESKPEPVAARFVWAVGYFTPDDYYLPTVQVKNLPEHVKRGQKWIDPDGTMRDVRLKRYNEGEKKIGIWEWRHNPFTDTRELNGLRVIMAVINNWDLKDANNAIFREKHSEQGPEVVYMISDLGATFGTTNFEPNHEKAKGNLESYEKSKFLHKVDGEFVDFDNPSRPSKIVAFNPKEFVSRTNLEWIGRHIPAADAKWIGTLLAKLTPEQIRDAFRAGGYSAEDVEAFAVVVESRIAELNKL
jgi:hypothetical protein